MSYLTQLDGRTAAGNRALQLVAELGPDDGTDSIRGHLQAFVLAYIAVCGVHDMLSEVNHCIANTQPQPRARPKLVYERTA